MTAESGDYKGRSEGSMADFEGSKGEFEVKRGGDLKDNVTAHPDGKEIGGSFVIVNGDSDDHSEKDLDLEEKPDPMPNADSGGSGSQELMLENGRDGEKVKSLVEDGELASGDEGKGEEKRVCGDSIRESLVEDEHSALGSGSDVKVEEEEQVSEGLVSESEEVAESESNAEEIKSDSGKVEEIEKGVDFVIEGEEETALDVNVEPEGEEIVNAEISSDTVDEMQDAEAMVVVKAEDKIEELPPVQQEESAVTDAGNGSQRELGAEVEEEDMKEPETVVAETDHLEEAEPTAQEVEEEETDHLEESEPTSRGDEEQQASHVEEPEASSQVKEAQESVVSESTDRGDAEPSEVEGSQNVTEKAANVADVKSDVEEEAQHAPETVFEEACSVHLVEKQKQESETVTEETDEQVERETEAEEEPEAVLAVIDTVEAEEEKVPESVVEAPSALEAETNQGLETVVSASSVTEAEIGKESEPVSTDDTKTSEHLPLENGGEGITVLSAAKIEAEVGKEPEAVTKETPSVSADSAIDEPSGLLEDPSTENAEASVICDVGDITGSGVEISGDSVKDDPSGEATDISLETSEIPGTCNVAAKELVEVSRSADDNHVDPEVSNGQMVLSEPNNDAAIPDNGADVKQTNCKFSHPEGTELEKKNWSDDIETNEDVAVEIIKLESESGNESTEDSECVVSSTEGDGSVNKDDDEEQCHDQGQAAEAIESPPETHVVKLHYLYMIKVPRFVDDELQQKIEHARLMVEEKTKIRDSLGEKTRKQAIILEERIQNYNDAADKEWDARAALNAKRLEIEKDQALINSINNATSITDIDDKIRNIIHRQQHETISLKQEKQYINEINQMKRLREQLSLRKAPQEQLDRALSQKDEIEARFKSLRKELDSLRTALSSAESSIKSAQDRCAVEETSLWKLKEEHKAADDVRQEAYLHWRKLRNQAFEKAKHFKMFKADQSTATNYRFSGDNQGLRSHCSKQVERIMDLWNNDKEFREQYVKSNTHSTVRRLGTLDGRSLGPDEQSPIVRSYVNRSLNIVSAAASQKTEARAPVLAREVIQDNLATKQVGITNQPAKLKSPAKPTVTVGSVPIVSNGVDPKEEEKMNKLRKEEEELARKQEELARKEEELRKVKAAEEEELRKEKAAAELKEQLRLEQKAKAREAEERKRRKAEKAQAKAEYRAQKEAELREKKKAMKENKKSGTADTTNEGTEGGSSVVSERNPLETSQKVETTSTASSRKKKNTRLASSMKQYPKVQSPVPLPLRNRGKRKMTTWMWALLVTLLVIVIFITGNYLSFSPSDNPGFGF